MRWDRSVAAAIVVMGLNAAMAADQIAPLQKQLESDNTEIRIGAAHSLGELGPRSAVAVPDLVKVTKGDNLLLRLEATIALGKIASNPQAAVPALTSLLSDKDSILRNAAIESLRSFGPDAKSALPQLQPLLKSKEPQTSVTAASAIASIVGNEREPQVAEAIPVLVAGLSQKGICQHRRTGAVDRRATGSASAAEGFGRIRSSSQGDGRQCSDSHGPRGRAPAVEQLSSVASSGPTEVRWHAIRALGVIQANPQTVVPLMTKMLQEDTDPIIRTHATHALESFGPAAASSVEALTRALLDKNEYVRIAAAGRTGSNWT